MIFRLRDTPVLLIIFNRVSTTKQVFEAIRRARPPRLYIAADGPRSERVGEAESVARVRQIAAAVDWPCVVKTLFRESNLGCKYAVSTAIAWFFEQEEKGIILEDDCLPHSDFFRFCEGLLHYYINDPRVLMITGDNFQRGAWRGTGSYYFSQYSHIWGWASWRRAWRHYDCDMKFWPEWQCSRSWRERFPDSVERLYWEGIFDDVYKGKIDTWDYQWLATVLFHNGLSATPNVNLVSNIGFGRDATHTLREDSPFSKLAVSSLDEIAHPTQVQRDVHADLFDFNWTFGGRHMRSPRRMFSVLRSVRHYLKRVTRDLRR